jgi:hypothetical protein
MKQKDKEAYLVDLRIKKNKNKPTFRSILRTNREFNDKKMYYIHF